MLIMSIFLLGRPIIVDFSPVTDFREATCRQYEENICNRGGYCNFMHLKKISRQVCGCNSLFFFFGGLCSVSCLVAYALVVHICSVRELRRQLFGRNRRRRSRSRSRSPYRHRGHEEHPHGPHGPHGPRGPRGSNRRDDDRDHRYHDRGGRRPRSRSPARRGGRSRSPGGRRNKSPVREGSAERRAKIEQWNREREQAEATNKNDNSHSDNGNNNNDFEQDDQQYYNPQHQEEDQQQQQQHGGYNY